MIAADTPRRRTIAIDGTAGAGTIAALEFGPATRPLDILFLHANGFNAMTYRQILQPLASDLRILAIDMRGHGHSTLPTTPEGHAWQTYANDVLALLATLGETPRVLAGHSMGGATALLAAPHLAAPHSVNLVLFDPVVAEQSIYEPATATRDYDQPMAQGALRRRAVFQTRAEAFAAYRGRGAFKTWPDAILQDYLEDGLTAQPAGTFTLACAPQWEATNFACYGISSPYPGFAGAGGTIRVLKAEHGSVCFINGDEPKVAGPGATQVETVAGTSHFLPMERADLVRDTLRQAANQGF